MADLQRISREGGANVEVALRGAPAFFCQEVVRRLPGRRLVCRGLWRGEAAYAKLFLGEGAQRYAARDARGARALAAHGLLTPPLLHEGELAAESGRALIYAAVADSIDAESAWEAADAAARRQLALALVATVARHHAAGLLQTDLYLRNFLCADAGLYTLDGDGIRVCRKPVGKRASLANLALLLSKFDVLEEAALPEWLQRYLAARGWTDDVISPGALRERVRATRRRIALGYAWRKVLRSCTDVRVERSFDRFAAVARAAQSEELQRVMDDPDRFLDAPGCRRLKNGNTCTVGLVQAGARKIVIKRYNIKNWRHGLSRAWRRTRAAVSWSNAHLLRIYGIATPRPLALVERRWGWLRREGYFLAEFAEGPEVAAVFADPALPEETRRQAARRVAQLLYRLYLLQLEHGDLKASNLKLADGVPLLLDLDAMRQHRWGWRFRRRHARDLRRLLQNWHNAPDILRMLQAALMETYRGDPVLALAGIALPVTSEYK